jgi:hypothetical protein
VPAAQQGSKQSCADPHAHTFAHTFAFRRRCWLLSACPTYLQIMRAFKNFCEVYRATMVVGLLQVGHTPGWLPKSMPKGIFLVDFGSVTAAAPARGV